MELQKYQLEMGKRYYHRGLHRFGYYTDLCEQLERTNPDRTSIFIDFDGDIREVSLKLVRDYNA